MKVCVLTLGCKVNFYESEVIKSLFINNQDEIVSLKEKPEVVVINTCSVTNQSDAKSRKVIRSAKRENPEAIIVVCGCSSENHKEDLLPLGIDILLGNKDKTKIVEYVKDFIQNKKQITKFYNLINCDFEDMIIDNYYERTRAFVKIQDGCNNYCSYCIIPYMRGTIRNKNLDVAVEEIKDLVNEGFKEIVLTGIHTGSYPELIALIQQISAFEGLERIRISSIEITEINNQEFLEELKNNPKLCDHMHIPVQCASNNVLTKMNRKYKMDEYIKIIEKIRTIRPNINITTDLIVGFPTESEVDFNESYENAKKIGFGKIHVFPYSKRDGTAASKMNNIVSDEEKKERTHKMLKLSDELELIYYEKYLNKTVKVLIEEANEECSTGITSNYLKVIVHEKLEHNQIYEVIITEIKDLTAVGVLSNCKNEKNNIYL